MNTDTNTLKLMTWSKAKTAIVAAACLLLAAGTATVIIYNMGKSMRSIRAEWSAISGDSGQWSFENGKIKAHTVTGDSIFASREKYGDVTFSAVASTTNREASLAIRLQDANNGYLIVFAPANTPGNADGFIRLIQRTSGNNTTIATYQKRNLVTVGKSAKIKVVAKGSLITVFLNGEKILQAHDTTFTAGYIGFRIYGWGDFPCDATFSKVTF
jgi:hypothetical protein